MSMKWILITNDPVLAREAEAAGVARIMVDLEHIGKQERQHGHNTYISNHRPQDIAPVRAVLKEAKLIVRINPWYAGSAGEIEQAIEAGADLVMLPMITELTQYEAFVEVLAGRAQPLPLVETAYSMRHISAIAQNTATRELYIGLNDLHLSLGLDFLFEPLAMGLVDDMAHVILTCGKHFGFGGIAAIDGGGELPAERILAEHARLGSDSVILSSRFWKDVRLNEPSGRPQRLAAAVSALQNAYHHLKQRKQALQQSEAAETFAMIKTLAKAVRTSKTA